MSNSVLTDPTNLQLNLYGHTLPRSADHDVVFIRVTDILADLQSGANPYEFKKNGEVPEKVGEVVQAGMYEWKTKEMKTILEEHPEEVEVTSVIYMRSIKNITHAEKVNDDNDFAD